MFIFLSGFVLFYQYFDKPLTLGTVGSFYRKRLKQLVIPYVFVSLGYELVVHALNHDAWAPASMLKQFGEHLVFGKSYAHLYYIVIMLQFYLLFPLLLLAFRKFPSAVRMAVPLGFAVQWAFYLLNREEWHLSAKGSLSFTYFAAFMLGAYLGARGTSYLRWFANRSETGAEIGARRIPAIAPAVVGLLWAATSIAFLWIYISYRTGGTIVAGYWFEIGYNLYTLLTTVILLKLCRLPQRSRITRFIADRLTRLGALSFGIYLVHPFFLLLYRKYMPVSGQPVAYHLWTMGSYAFALGASIAVLLFAYRYVGWSQLVFGPAPVRQGREVSVNLPNTNQSPLGT